MVTFDVVGAVHETVMVLVLSWVRVGLMGAAGAVEPGGKDVYQYIVTRIV